MSLVSNIIIAIFFRLKGVFFRFLVFVSNAAFKKNIDSSGAVVGDGVTIGLGVTITGFDDLTIGNNVYIGSGCFIRAEGGLEIGDNVIISRNVVIYTQSHNYNGQRLPFDETYLNRKVKICSNTWIGMNATISPGTIIGEGVIVALGSNVYGEIPERAIVGTCSPKIIGFRHKTGYIARKRSHAFGDKDGRVLKNNHIIG